MAGVRTAEETARRLRYRNAWQHAKRAANRAAALCLDCGKPCSAPTMRRGFCADCAVKIVRRETEKRIAARAAKEAARKAAMLAPNAPVCPHCGGRDLMRSGTSAGGTQRFRCRGCGRWSYGKMIAPPVNKMPCPYCKARCVKSGFAAKGQRRKRHRGWWQRYVCTGCGRKNKDLYPWRQRDPDGPFPYVMTFYFGPAAYLHLLNYCRETRQTVNRAVREIFRDAAYHSIGCYAVSAERVYAPDGYSYLTLHSPPRKRDPRIDATMRLPDIRSESMRARMQRTGNSKYAPTVLD